MKTSDERVFLWRHFTLREAVLLGFCATFIILTRAGLRLHLHLPGHVMFFTMFFFLLARGCVPKIGSVTLVGLITCLASALLGMGNVGVMVLVLYLLPALVVEVIGVVYPKFINGLLACAAVGMVASAVRAATASSVEVMIGLEDEFLVAKAITSITMNAVFGGLGSLAVPSIVRTLKRNGLIDDPASEAA
ncbi:hypothetical protein [Geomonas sp.]|uniref:hypothetical protein n=1 Tax=Geomonas sp. TaxID=2651584 RepID=UPI002B46869D|nr:hypothetical protein [Geomonas sp.]HJV35203.1 hypothetical protein [Geomonas sp.]